MILAAFPWTGGGMSPLRIDRAQLVARVEDAPAWVVHELIDAFEPAALKAMAEARAAKRKGEGEADG